VGFDKIIALYTEKTAYCIIRIHEILGRLSREEIIFPLMDYPSVNITYP